MKNFESSFDFIFSNAIMIAIEICSGKITIRFLLCNQLPILLKKNRNDHPGVFSGPQKKRELLVFRRLDLFWQTALEVLLDLAVILPEVVVHGRVDLLLRILEMTLGNR